MANLHAQPLTPQVSMIASYMPTGEIPGLGRVSGTAVSFTDFLLGFVLAASNTVAGECVLSPALPLS
jgi:hypothetical protein